jgi:hypothetical protein
MMMQPAFTRHAGELSPWESVSPEGDSDDEPLIQMAKRHRR